jgi:hypothetical protein
MELIGALVHRPFIIEERIAHDMDVSNKAQEMIDERPSYPGHGG